MTATDLAARNGSRLETGCAGHFLIVNVLPPGQDGAEQVWRLRAALAGTTAPGLPLPCWLRRGEPTQRQPHVAVAATCLCRRANAPLQSRALCTIYLQTIQLLGEDGAVANISAGPFRSCSGGSVFVIDGPIT